MPGDVSELAHTRAVVEYLQWRGWKATHIRNIGPHAVVGDPGWPDVSAARGARLLFIEIKRGTNKPTEVQLDWHRALVQAGANVLVATLPEEWPELEREIDRLSFNQ